MFANVKGIKCFVANGWIFKNPYPNFDLSQGLSLRIVNFNCDDPKVIKKIIGKFIQADSVSISESAEYINVVDYSCRQYGICNILILINDIIDNEKNVIRIPNDEDFSYLHLFLRDPKINKEFYDRLKSSNIMRHGLKHELLDILSVYL